MNVSDFKGICIKEALNLWWNKSWVMFSFEVTVSTENVDLFCTVEFLPLTVIFSPLLLQYQTLQDPWVIIELNTGLYLQKQKYFSLPKR